MRVPPFLTNRDPGDEQPETWRACEDCDDYTDTFTLQYARCLCRACSKTITTKRTTYAWPVRPPEDE